MVPSAFTGDPVEGLPAMVKALSGKFLTALEPSSPRCFECGKQSASLSRLEFLREWRHAAAHCVTVGGFPVPVAGIVAGVLLRAAEARDKLRCPLHAARPHDSSHDGRHCLHLCPVQL